MGLTDRRLDLIADGFDLAVRIGELQASSMIGRRVGTYRFVLVASPGFAEKYGVPRRPADLGTLPCLINLNMSPRNRWPFERGAVETAEVSGGLQIDNGEALRAAVLEGAGIAYMPIDLVADVGEQRRPALRVDGDLLLHRRHRAVDHLLQVVTHRDQDPESLLLDRFAVSDRLQNSARHRTPPSRACLSRTSARQQLWRTATMSAPEGAHTVRPWSWRSPG